MSRMAELILRTVDLERPEPDAAVLDRLAATGHARHGFCDPCWAEAGRRAMTDPDRTQAQHYFAVLDEEETR